MDFHSYLNWDGQTSFSQARAKVCRTVPSQAIKKSTITLSFLRWIACDYRPKAPVGGRSIWRKGCQR